LFRLEPARSFRACRGHWRSLHRLALFSAALALRLRLVRRPARQLPYVLRAPRGATARRCRCGRMKRGKRAMHFGITFKTDLSLDRIVSLTRQAEAAGFTYAWMFDSHVLWKEPFPLLTLMAANTQRMHLGTCVTNPAVRDVTVSASLFATLNLISGGRMELGIGRGDSSRRVLGNKPTTLANLEEFVRHFRA